MRETVRVPVARNADGSSITGPIVVRWSDLPAGTTTLALDRAGYYSVGAVALGAYLPATLDTRAARLETHASETISGEVRGAMPVSSEDWAWGDCAHTPFPGAPDSTKICLRRGFDPELLYQLVYTAKDPLVLLLGFAAIRDVGSFFRYDAKDASGTANPIAGTIRAVIATGQSQSGNTQRTFIHYGFNEDDSGSRGRIVWDGANPHIAARQNPVNLRFARPGGAAGLYDPGSDAVIWWAHEADTARHRPGGGNAGSLSRDEHVSQNLRDARLVGVLGAASVARFRRHRCAPRHPAAAERAAILLPVDDPWRRRRRVHTFARKEPRRLRAAG